MAIAINLLRGWSKEDSQKNRRQVVLKHCHGNKLLAGHTLLNFHYRSRDTEIRQKARADALYFFNLCKRNGSK